MIEASPVIESDWQEKCDISLHVVDNNLLLLDVLKQKISDSEFGFKIQSLCQENLPSLLLIACQTYQDAQALTQKYNLQNLQVYWLLDQGLDKPQSTDFFAHQFINWRDSGILAALLPLFYHLQKALRDKLITEHKVALLSACLGEFSLTLSAQGKIQEINPKLLEVMGQQAHHIQGQDWLTCLQIPSNTAKDRMQQILSDLSRTNSMTRLPPFPIQFDKTVIMVDGFVGPLHNNESLLFLRQVASWQNQEWAEQMSTQNAPVTLLLINPDEFSELNRQQGREVGDQVLNEIMLHMKSVLRSDDFASRYSGAVFAAHLPETDEQQGQILATRMLKMLRERRYSYKKIKLEFSFGLATLETDEQLNEQSPFELFRRANAALQAARGIGGGKLVSWQPQFDANILANLDRMSGKFSEAPQEDFRLMTLQWDIIYLIGNSHSLQSFSEQMCQLLLPGLQSIFVGLYLRKGEKVESLSCQAENKAIDVDAIQAWALQEVKIINSDIRIANPFSQYCDYYHGVIPLVTRGQCLGVLVVCWRADDQRVAERCRTQLQQVTPNLAAAIDRITLLEDKNRRNAHTIKNDEGHELLFAAPAMSAVMQQLQLVAPTDASVLIIGESGTGKEMIAQQIHQRSAIAGKPFITVDCSTIVKQLIESELFGHRKGAFTGATTDQPGVIAQADGGTLFLDEVGELPLDIQAKLLRFVQEKTYVAVGEQRVRKVNVRLVLATNRNLQDEVNAGRFRADLYYRINVFTLNLPPLRERGDDPIMLAHHFLQKFSIQYNKDITGFSTAAIAKLRHYSWPGNIRELRNCLMRAVILCTGNSLEPEHLSLQNTAENKIDISPEALVSKAMPVNTSTSQAFTELVELLNEVVILASLKENIFSVSAWLEQQWLDCCLSKWGSLYKVAIQLDQSESTIRRRHSKLSKLEFSCPKLQQLTPQCSDLLTRLIDDEGNLNTWPKIESALHSLVLNQPISQQQKAHILNVTQPTLRKLKLSLQ